MSISFKGRTWILLSHSVQTSRSLQLPCRFLYHTACQWIILTLGWKYHEVTFNESASFPLLDYIDIEGTVEGWETKGQLASASPICYPLIARRITRASLVGIWKIFSGWHKQNLNMWCLKKAGLCPMLSFFFFFSFIFVSWRLTTPQYYSGFCHTLTWISHGVTFLSSQSSDWFLFLCSLLKCLPQAVFHDGSSLRDSFLFIYLFLARKSTV